MWDADNHVHVSLFWTQLRVNCCWPGKEDLLLRSSKNWGNSVLLYSLSSDYKHSMVFNYLNIASSLMWVKSLSIDLISRRSVTINVMVRSTLPRWRCSLSACALCSALKCIHVVQMFLQPSPDCLLPLRNPSQPPAPQSNSSTYLCLPISSLFSSASQGLSLQEARN